MKTKYLFFSVLFVFIVWGIVACKDDDGLDMPVELTIGGNQTTFEFPAMGGEQKLAMKSNYPWGAEMSPLEDSVWCKLKVSEKELVISPLQNLDTLVRSSRVKIFSGEGENMKTLYLDVVQKAGDKMSIMFSPEKVVFSPKEETREVMYMTFSPEIEYKWRGDTLVDWITVQLDAENSKLLLTSEFNELLTARRATLEVSGGVGGNRFTDTLAIEQMGNEPMIVANPDTVRIDAAGGSVDIEVLSTVEKYNVEASGWVKMELKEGETDKYLLSVEANPTLNERSIGILLSTPYDATPFVNGRLTVIQEGNVLAKISTDQEKVNFKTEGGEITVKVNSSWENWKAEVNEEAQEWCSISTEGDVLKVNATVSELETDRTATITLSTGAASNTASCEVVVTQLGTKPSLVLSTDRVTLNEAGDEVIVKVSTNAKLWGMTLPESEDKWCTVIQDDINNQIKISATPAEAGSRSVELIVEIPQTDVKVKLTIIQSKYYKVGDLYVVNGEPLGLVYEISDGGAHGKVVALKAHRDLNLWYRTGLPYDEIHPEDPNNVGVIARSETDGQENMKAYKQIPDWKTHYPVAAYVSDLNDENGNPGWYLPAIKEVQAMVGWIDGEVLSPDGEAGQEPSEAMKEKRKAINQLIVDNGGNEFYFYGYDVSFIIDQTNAWEADYFNRIYTSTETDYQVHPMVFKFYLRNGWWETMHVYGDLAGSYGEVRPFLAF